MAKERPRKKNLGKPAHVVTSSKSAITKEQIKVLSELGPLADKRGFYLAGGLALAFWLGHRTSADFDWFGQVKFGDGSLLAESLKCDGIEIQDPKFGRGTLWGKYKCNKISFFEYSYPLVAAPNRNDKAPCTLASLDDIAAMKLLALTQRSVKRDFVDVYYLMKNGMTLAHMFEMYKKKFNTVEIVQPKIGLHYFEGAENTPMPDMIASVEWETIKKTISNALHEYCKSERSGFA